MFTSCAILPPPERPAFLAVGPGPQPALRPTCLQDADITVDDVRRAAPEILRDADLEHYPYRVTEDMLVRAAEKLAG